MQIEKFSEIIAHFIGIFETTTDEMRLRAGLTEGTGPAEDNPALDDLVANTPTFASDLALQDYDPDVNYRSVSYEIVYGGARRFGRPFEESIEKLSEIAHRDVSSLPRFGSPQDIDIETEEELQVFDGPGSVIRFTTQVNILYDDDYLDMTGGNHAPRDTSFVVEKLAEFSAKAEIFSPFSDLHRTDTLEGVKQITGDMETYIQGVRDSGQTSIGASEPPADNPNDQAHDFVLAGDEITGAYMNGKHVSEIPALDDLLPDRGLAKLPEEPDETQTSVEHHDAAGNSLEVTAGANLVANIASVVNTAVISSVTAVMGDYHQVDAITQVYVYSDNDNIASVFHSADSAESAGVTAYNIASFERDTFQSTQPQTTVDAHGDPIFPMAWRVSVIEGDVSFVSWIEQYHFVTDNDTMTVTTNGSEATVLTGGNTALNFSSFFQMGLQYDLVIVAGNIYDINSITQISLLYDNDWARTEDGVDNGATIQSGNNLIWNLAAIHNVGADDRFETMPDYMHEAEKGIQERDPTMPEGLSTDSNFQGYIGLNVLYITGNLYDMTIIKQVAVLGDSDDVTQAAAELLKNNQDAVITIDTGSNTVANIAEIVDYDSFGNTTYVAGQLYSDAILIQGGIIEHDNTQPATVGEKLANEVIAFLDDDTPQGADGGDGIINGGHDLSWSSAHPSDVMQAVVA